MTAQPAVLKIELLALDLDTCDRCRDTDRNLETALSLIQGKLEARGVSVRLERRHVTSEAEAVALGMEISPTIRVNGHDIQLEWGSSTCGACSDLAGDAVPCRTWQWQGGEHNEAPVEMIIEAFMRAASEPVVSPTGSNARVSGKASEPIRRFFAGPNQCCAPQTGGVAKKGNEIMKKLEVFDPAMCCSTGVCGVDVDPVLAQFAADLKWISEQGVVVERHNLGQEPQAFAANPAVVREMEAGMDRLPILVIDGKIVTTGLYPSRTQLVQKIGLAATQDVSPAPVKQSCCSPKSGCC